MEYLEENKIITISLGNKVKEKIKNKFNRDIEEFIEKEFPQDEELKIFIFKHKRLLGNIWEKCDKEF